MKGIFQNIIDIKGRKKDINILMNLIENSDINRFYRQSRPELYPIFDFKVIKPQGRFKVEDPDSNYGGWGNPLNSRNAIFPTNKTSINISL